jgi:hypothetical protein
MTDGGIRISNFLSTEIDEIVIARVAVDGKRKNH